MAYRAWRLKSDCYNEKLHCILRVERAARKLRGSACLMWNASVNELVNRQLRDSSSRARVVGPRGSLEPLYSGFISIFPLGRRKLEVWDTFVDGSKEHWTLKASLLKFTKVYSPLHNFSQDYSILLKIIKDFSTLLKLIKDFSSLLKFTKDFSTLLKFTQEYQLKFSQVFTRLLTFTQHYSSLLKISQAYSSLLKISQVYSRSLLKITQVYLSLVKSTQVN